MLYTFTLIVNALAMVAALWLGLYVVTRSPRSQIAWLTGLTLWALAGLFVNVLLTVDPVPAQAKFPEVFWLVFPFLYRLVPTPPSFDWPQAWVMMPAIVIWHHATMLMRPRALNPWRWFRILLGYALMAIGLYIQAITPLPSTYGDNPLYVAPLEVAPIYQVLFFLFVISYTALAIANLWRSARSAPAAMPRQQLFLLNTATIVAGLAAPIGMAGASFGVPVPIVALSLPLGVAVVMLGYGVARYSALVAGRTIRSDFIYSALAIAVVTGVYLVVMWVSSLIYDIHRATFILIVMMVVITHSLISVARRTLDSLFYRRETRRLRANLQHLTALAGEGEGKLEENLSLVLESMCASVRATYGLIVTFDGDGLQLVAAHRWRHDSLPLTPADLAADDVLPLKPGHFAAPLAEAALLFPLYGENEQLGALLLGRPVNSPDYSAADIELLLDPGDRLSDAIYNARRETEYLEQIAKLIEEKRPDVEAMPVQMTTKMVEQGLRKLTDYAALGKSPLATLRLVRSQLPDGTATHLDRGKALHGVLVEGVEKLRPEGQPARDLPSREWYPYLILYDAYLKDVPNRDIMARLYISEGTFNRTRRAALRAVTQVLEEMEAALR